jgi:hypothetical protein
MPARKPSTASGRPPANAEAGGRFHAKDQHVNFCKAPQGQKAAYFGPDAKFGLLGSINTKEACDAAGGEFHPHIFGWMVHVYPYESDPKKIWSTDDDDQGHDNHGSLSHAGDEDELSSTRPPPGKAIVRSAVAAQSRTLIQNMFSTDISGLLCRPDGTAKQGSSVVLPVAGRATGKTNPAGRIESS